MVENELLWLDWSQRLQAIAQSGLAYCKNIYDIERYHQIMELAAEISATHSDVDFKVVKDLFDTQSGYATPKLDCRGVIFQDGKILLVREIADGGRWTLPGGWVDVNDRPSEAVEREVREEAGLIVRSNRLLALYDRNLHGHPPYAFHTYKIFMQCELLGHTQADPKETSDATFFGRDEIPPLSLLRTTPEEISRLFYLHEHPELDTEFD